jgi:hypothetical protein
MKLQKYLDFELIYLITTYYRDSRNSLYASEFRNVCKAIIFSNNNWYKGVCVFTTSCRFISKNFKF